MIEEKVRDRTAHQYTKAYTCTSLVRGSYAGEDLEYSLPSHSPHSHKNFPKPKFKFHNSNCSQ